ncbi:MAG: hypothetical protein K1X83_02570 [Oligoflexia bacterium]|nr:hypothetical protein [Oligoflexia bacterium]
MSSSALTIFSCPRNFVGLNGVIQRAALASWVNLSPRPQIHLFGNELGVDEVAEEYGAKYTPHILRNDFDTPYLDYIVGEAEAAAAGPIVVYCASDAILKPGLLTALATAQARFPQFVMYSCRKEIPAGILDADPTPPDIHRLDFFAFTKGIWAAMPGFVVGHRAAPRWLLHDAARHSVPVIDIRSPDICLHQQHDYKHTLWGSEERLISSPEASQDNHLADDVPQTPLTSFASHILEDGNLVENRDPRILSFVQTLRSNERALSITRAEVFLHAAEEAMYRGHDQESLRLLHKGDRTCPNMTRLRLFMAAIHFRLEDFDAAVAEAKTILNDPVYGQGAQNIIAAVERERLTAPQVQMIKETKAAAVQSLESCINSFRSAGLLASLS